MPNFLLPLIWAVLPMVIVSLLAKKFAECYLREAKPIIIGIISTIVALMILVATIGGFYVGIYLYAPEKILGDRVETVEKTEPSVEELEDEVVE